ncbi:unnamed protein product [Caenorhabditis angaria]|uniref:DUF7778 domain-containing protein n=1 Tax=Caenorhabditis angaria TaxID=860376 RepID=A0A9P1IPZ6_9PELO|nr:unnamed protein product [Caenorhabditis angaria]
MKQQQLRERKEVLPIAKKLYKFVNLPNAMNWRVEPNECLAHGRIASYTRTKNRFFPDNLTCLKMRLATVTCHGFLILYEKSDRGIVVDLRKARAILTNCDTFKGDRLTYKRCHIKIRLDFGNVHLFVKDDSISKWTSAIITSHSNIKKGLVIKKETVPVLENIAISDTEEINNSVSSNSGIITVIENPKINQIPSIRHGHSSVASICKKLESELAMKSPEDQPSLQNTKHFVSSVVYEPEKEQKSQIEIKESAVFVLPSFEEENGQGTSKAWWLRSLRC